MFACCVLPALAFAQSTPFSFTDVPLTSPVHAALEALVANGAITAGGSFRPNDKLTRAEAVKILLSATMKPDELAKITVSSFPDVAPDAWYMRFAEAARMRKMVSASASFNADGVITKAAFIKMLLLANKIDPSAAFSDIHAALSSDVSSGNEWYYAPMRYAVAVSMTAANKDGLLSPSREITRADSALILDRFDGFIAGERTQVLLSQTESEITRVLALLNRKDLQEASSASTRSLLTARGALTLRPNEPLTQGAVKIAKGFQSLVLSYAAGAAGRIDDVIKYAKEAYAAADKAETISPALSGVTRRMRTIAKSLADEARKIKP